MNGGWGIVGGRERRKGGGEGGKQVSTFDALKLEAEPLFVHGTALLQLAELLLVLQVVLLEGCASAAPVTQIGVHAVA